MIRVVGGHALLMRTCLRVLSGPDLPWGPARQGFECDWTVIRGVCDLRDKRVYCQEKLVRQTVRVASKSIAVSRLLVSLLDQCECHQEDSKRGSECETSVE